MAAPHYLTPIGTGKSQQGISSLPGRVMVMVNVCLEGAQTTRGLAQPVWLLQISEAKQTCSGSDDRCHTSPPCFGLLGTLQCGFGIIRRHGR